MWALYSTSRILNYREDDLTGPETEKKQIASKDSNVLQSNATPHPGHSPSTC